LSYLNGENSAAASDPTCLLSAYQVSTIAVPCNTIEIIVLFSEIIICFYVMYHLHLIGRLIYCPKPNLQTFALTIIPLSALVRITYVIVYQVFNKETGATNGYFVFFSIAPDIIGVVDLNLLALFLRDLTAVRFRIVDPARKSRLIWLLVCSIIQTALAFGTSIASSKQKFFLYLYYLFFSVYWFALSISILSYAIKLRRHLKSSLRQESFRDRKNTKNKKEVRILTPSMAGRTIVESSAVNPVSTTTTTTPQQQPQSSPDGSIIPPLSPVLSPSSSSSPIIDNATLGSISPSSRNASRISTGSTTTAPGSSDVSIPSYIPSLSSGAGGRSRSRFSLALLRVITLALSLSFYCWFVIGLFLVLFFRLSYISASEFVVWNFVIRVLGSLMSFAICYIFFPHQYREPSSGSSSEKNESELKVVVSPPA